ncbi:MAG: hypothetical protein ABJG41_13575 [Cyclobacteriaceae bacterium]
MREFGGKKYKLARFFMILQETDLCNYPDYQIGTVGGRREFGISAYKFLGIQNEADNYFREFKEYTREKSDSKEVKRCLGLIEEVKLSEKK